MSFRDINQRFLAPGAQSLMIFGIISLCQPWSLFLHQYGVTLTLIGLVCFLVTSKIAPEPEEETELADELAETVATNDTLHGSSHRDREAS